jgi:effector-binding domain-containing protein
MSGHVVDVRSEPARPTAVVAQTTTWREYSALWPKLLDEVYGFVRGHPELSPTPHGKELWRNVMLYLDDTPAVEVGVLVARAFPAAGRVTASALPAGSVATTLHRGPYAQLDQAHRAVQDAAAARGLALAGPRWEIYGHWRADPRELETEVYYLLR